MRFLENNKLIEALNWRYAVKKFDATKKIDEATWNAIEDALVLTPSSYGLQPWKFLVITDKSVMQKLTPVSWGQKQVEDCSHLVVIAAKEKMDVSYVDRYITSIVKERAVKDPSILASLEGLKKMIVGNLIEGPESASVLEWSARQAYIALGNLMTAAAVLGIDACPMEGIIKPKYDEFLGLEGSGFQTIVACPFGYRAHDDKYAHLKKIRFPHDEIIKKI
jgi:nitroreductase